jgi:thioredoxin 1
MSGRHVLPVTDATFDDEVLRSPVPVLVDFTAAWCGPCRVIAPHVAAVAEANAGQLRVATLDVDDNIQVATRFQVRSMPTLLLFQGGNVVGQIVGAVPRSKIEAFVAKVLPAAAAAL